MSRSTSAQINVVAKANATWASAVACPGTTATTAPEDGQVPQNCQVGNICPGICRVGEKRGEMVRSEQKVCATLKDVSEKGNNGRPFRAFFQKLRVGGGGAL
jgi:hypothetical protein